jgi:hypothetical protein
MRLKNNPVKKSLSYEFFSMIVALHKKYLLLFIFSWLCPGLNSQSTNDFGSKDRIVNGLEGKIFVLSTDTRKLPDFDTMSSLGTIYTKELNIPGRSWTTGFPGVTDRVEWFGIEYKATFTVKKEGQYTFTLLSDDGSKLFIDDSLVIDNDGLHGKIEKSNIFGLDKSTHKIKIQYFQGPRFEIALQLFAKLDNENQEIFPGNNFVLTTPASRSGAKSLFIWILIAGLILLLFVTWYRRKRKKPAATQ